MRLGHIAWCKRSEGHAGGVPLFGHYLATRLGAIEWSWADAPPHVRIRTPGEVEAARRLGEWLQGEHLLRECGAIVVDGFWGRGIRLDRIPMFSVAHNTWRSIGRALHSRQAEELGNVQEAEYRRLPTVAVSDQTARDLLEFYGVSAAATIRNGVDVDEFRPAQRPLRQRPLVLYPSAHYPKGGDVVEALQQRMPHVDFELLGGSLGGEARAMQRGDLLLSPSRTEGCSYARLQAMACGLPVVASETGLFADGATLDGLLVGTTVAIVGTQPDRIVEWELAVRAALQTRESLGEAARAWAEAHGNLERWESEWRRLVETSST